MGVATENAHKNEGHIPGPRKTVAEASLVPQKIAGQLGKGGTPGGTRTPDAQLRTLPLYPLSYRGMQTRTGMLCQTPYGGPRGGLPPGAVRPPGHQWRASRSDGRTLTKSIPKGPVRVKGHRRCRLLAAETLSAATIIQAGRNMGGIPP